MMTDRTDKATDSNNEVILTFEPGADIGGDLEENALTATTSGQISIAAKFWSFVVSLFR